MNLEGYEVDVVAADELTVEDRWLLSRLSTVAEQATEAIEQFKYSEAARTLYDFAWDEFCSFYVEMAKNRLADPAARPAAQRILAHALDVLLRLLHPITPFITEEVWRLLNQAAPKRGLSKLVAPTEQIAIAPWPDVEAERQDAQIESQFRHFQTVLAALRDIRSRNNIPPKTPIEFSIRCDEEMSRLLQPMAPYFDSMAGARAVAWGAEVVAPLVSGSASLPGADVYVDLKDVIDVEAEIQRQESQLDKLKKLSEAKQRKLENPQFTDRAPQDVVRQEREGSQQLLSQIESIHESIAALRAMSLKSK
jgi:valyl-tRNA synthetase